MAACRHRARILSPLGGGAMAYRRSDFIATGLMLVVLVPVLASCGSGATESPITETQVVTRDNRIPPVPDNLSDHFLCRAEYKNALIVGFVSDQFARQSNFVPVIYEIRSLQDAFSRFGHGNADALRIRQYLL